MSHVFPLLGSLVSDERSKWKICFNDYESISDYILLEAASSQSRVKLGAELRVTRTNVLNWKLCRSLLLYSNELRAKHYVF